MENLKKELISSILSGQSTLETKFKDMTVVFEILPTIPRESQKNRELIAEREADRLIQILLTEAVKAMEKFNNWMLKIVRSVHYANSKAMSEACYKVYQANL